MQGLTVIRSKNLRLVFTTSTLKVMPESGYLPYSFRGKWNQKPSYGDFYCVEVFAKFEFLKEFLSRVFWQRPCIFFFFFFQLSPGVFSWDPLLHNQFAPTLSAFFNLNQSKQCMRVCYNISLLLTTSYFFHNPLAGRKWIVFINFLENYHFLSSSIAILPKGFLHIREKP